MKQIHYVVNLVVKRVETDDLAQRPHQGAPPTRKVGDVISLTVRGGDLESLKEQLKNHLLIATDDISVPLDEEKNFK